MIDFNTRINSFTSIYGLVGYPVEHSLSPKFWNTAFDYLGINSVYLAFPVLPNNIVSALNGFWASGIKGLNVTRPHKKAAADFCNVLNGAAKETQIVNTIKFTEFGGEGWNTDATGFYRILKRFQLSKKSALVIGDGASSKSVIWALKKYGVSQISQIARKFTETTIAEKSNEKKLRKFLWNTKNFNYTVAESDIIINTTPIGWQKDDNISEVTDALDSSKSFVDFNYRDDSKLLIGARQSCGVVIDGRELLYEQGVESFKILMNCEPPADVIRSSIFS